MYDVIIVGGGPAGLTTALYTSRSGRKTLVLERELPGGLVATTDEIENWPGTRRITGAELAEQFKEHAEAFGAEIVMDQVQSLELDGDVKRVIGADQVYEGRSVVIASGSAPRLMGVPGEDTFRGRGVSYCATCDGAFFRDRVIACVGGGDAAVQEALYLTRFAAKVHLIHRRDQLRAVDVLRQRAMASDKLEIVWDSVVEEVQGDQLVEGVALRNVKTDEQSVLPVSGVFVYIGHTPATAFLRGLVDLTDDGYIPTSEHMETNVPGVFAAGDVRPKIQRQISTAVGDGATAAQAVELYLADLPMEG